MSIDVSAFRPSPNGGSVQIIGTNAATAATAVCLTTNASGTFKGAENDVTVRLMNLGTSVCFVGFGGTGATATTTSGIPIAVNAVGEKFSFAGYSHIASLTVSGTSTLIATLGGGI